MNWKRNRTSLSSDEQSAETQIISLGDLSNTSEPQGNKIYFYSEVNKDTILTLNKQIDDLTKSMKNIQATYNLFEPPPIEIHICSDGGDVFAALACVDKIIKNPVRIYTICEGSVASAGTLISVVGHKRFITEHSCMLLHQLSSECWGNYAQIQDQIKNLDMTMNVIKNIYLKRTNFKSDDLDVLLSHDLFLSAKECKDIGLVDEIL